MSELPPPEFEAMREMLSEAFNREMALRAELIRLRRDAYSPAPETTPRAKADA